MVWRKVDPETGIFLEDVVLDEPPVLADGTPDPAYIEMPVPQDAGFYHARWDFAAGVWVEGLTPEEIAERLADAPPAELSELEKLKIRQDASENAILFLMDMGGML